MTTIGNDTIPGVQTTVDTADSIGISVDAPANAAIVGPADLTNGTAEANDVVAVTRPGDAREALGDPENSMLAQQAFYALGEGAQPVYAVPTDEVTETEDLSDLSSTSGTLENAPVSENPEDTTFTVDTEDKTTVITLENPNEATVGSGEVYLNPLTGDYELDTAPETSGSVEATSFDYETAMDTVAEEYGETIDFLAPVQENPDVANYAHTTVKNMEGFYDFAIALCGLLPDTGIAEDIPAVEWDSSRMQVIYPARNANGESAIGAYAGRRASLGISASAMGKSLSTQGRMYRRISVVDEQNLVNNNIVPIRSATGGARIVDDPTTVTDNNSEEAGMRQGYARMVMDQVIEVVNVNEQPFIGRLNTPEARNALQNILNAELGDLLESNAIQAYQVSVQERDAMSVGVDVTVDTTDPLRNIYNTVTAGQIA